MKSFHVQDLKIKYLESTKYLLSIYLALQSKQILLQFCSATSNPRLILCHEKSMLERPLIICPISQCVVLH